MVDNLQQSSKPEAYSAKSKSADNFPRNRRKYGCHRLGTPRRCNCPVRTRNNGTVIAGGAFREIGLWDATTYEIRMVICQPQGCQRAEALTFSPCGRYLISGASWQGTISVNFKKKRRVFTFENVVAQSTSHRCKKHKVGLPSLVP